MIAPLNGETVLDSTPHLGEDMHCPHLPAVVEADASAPSMIIALHRRFVRQRRPPGPRPTASVVPEADIAPYLSASGCVHSPERLKRDGLPPLSFMNRAEGCKPVWAEPAGPPPPAPP
jgi:hypothetical protein